MAALKKQKTFYDKKKEFSKFAIPAMKIDSVLHQYERRLKPLIFEICNGGYPWSFTDAFIQYRKQKLNFNFDLWYMYSYKKLIDIIAGEEDNIAKDDRPIFECLFDFLSGNHLSCLKSLLDLSSSGNLSEVKITTIMALHYFKPLVPNGAYVVDNSNPSCHAKCELCAERIVYGDTSIGNKRVWHGKVDILLQRSIVKVSLEKDLEDLNLKDEDEDKEIEETSICKEELACGLAKSQLVSQVIVNAFFTSGKQKFLHNQFIPSFFVTEKYIRIVLYHIELDILLMSTKLPIWDKERSGELDVMTLIRVWLALNYSGSMDKSPEQYQTFLKYTNRSNFKKLLPDDAYSVYLNNMQQPLNSEKIVSDSYSDDNAGYGFDTQEFALNCILELNKAMKALDSARK
ncbi:uncharacterized protein LOC127708928 [Mytilus californianus]|uniref:uncharacterized protein LOC127708928 n=1 Tax=Mytilus californianus TaxID=6549 RepID=UPI002246013E|nr:uncharacterized protein LOC127708928 [Mytilus californianus]